MRYVFGGVVERMILQFGILTTRAAKRTVRDT
jgi:hypothetical protein